MAVEMDDYLRGSMRKFCENFYRKMFTAMPAEAPSLTL